jgi:hypothetical protein
MATSFNTGFKLGSDMFTQAQRNRLAEEELGMARERDARAAELHDFNVAALNRQRAKDAEVDSLTQQLTRPNAENYALAPSGGATGLGMRGSMPPAMGDTAGVAPTGLRMPAQGDAAPATGLRAPTMPDRPLTFNQAPTGAAAEDILGRIALTRGDTAGFRGSQAAARGFREDDIFRDRLKEFKGTPEQIGSTMSYLNQNSRSVTMGKPDKDGFVQLSVVKPDGDAAFARLTKQDQAKLYAAAGLMEVNPQRAFDMMAQVNKELAAAIAVENGMNVDMTKAGNDVASKRGKMDLDRQGLGVKRDELKVRQQQLENQNTDLGIRRRVADAQIGSYNRANRSTIELLTAEAERLVKTGDFKDVPTAIEALKRGSVKPEYTPQNYTSTLKNLTDAGMPLPEARVMTDQLFGRADPAKDVPAQLKALNDKKGGAKPGAAPAPAAAPAAPLGLQQRLGNAIGADNSAGNRNQFIRLADEAAKTAPIIQQQIEVLRNALPMTRSMGERSNLERRIGELESDLSLYGSILEQRNAQRGY